MSNCGCEFCSKPFNRPAGEAFTCPYCGKVWQANDPARRCPYSIVEIGGTITTPGNATGGNKRFLKVGLTREVCGPGADGGPELIAACPTQEAAERVKRALESLPELQAACKAAIDREGDYLGLCCDALAKSAGSV